jgi:hypothetical protein
MADTKITALAAIATVDPAADVLPIVDISDTSMAASGTTKKVTTNQILQAGGTATLASATITGAATVGTTLGVTGNLTVGTNALIVIPATNRVLINQSAAIQGDPLEISAKSDGGAISLFGRASDNVAILSFRANGAATQKAAVQAGDTGVDLLTGSTVRQSISASTGNVTISTGNVVMATSGKGIDFSATANSSGTMTSELLNDYEEGTFTPTLGGTATYTTQVGRYTKIGNRVFFDIRIIVLLIGTGSANTISGLPFAVGASSNLGAISVGYFASLASSVVYVSGLTVNGTSTIVMNSAASATASITNTSSVIGNTTDLALSGFYEV